MLIAVVLSRIKSVLSVGVTGAIVPFGIAAGFGATQNLCSLLLYHGITHTPVYRFGAVQMDTPLIVLYIPKKKGRAYGPLIKTQILLPPVDHGEDFASVLQLEEQAEHFPASLRFQNERSNYGAGRIHEAVIRCEDLSLFHLCHAVNLVFNFHTGILSFG